MAFRPIVDDGDINKICFGVLEDHCDHFWPYQSLLSLSPQIKIMCFGLKADWICMSGDDLCANLKEIPLTALEM